MFLNLTVLAFGRTNHLFGHYFQTMIHQFKLPRLSREAGCPHKPSVSYRSPQNDPGSPA
jgi:hypothetical protein